MIKNLKLVQAYKIHQNLLKDLAQGSLLSLSLILLLFCKQISGYIANYDLDIWYDKFIIIERLSMLLLLFSVYKYLKGKCWLLYELLVFFLLQDFIDRAFFNVGYWNFNDTIGIIFIIIQLLIKLKNKYDDR